MFWSHGRHRSKSIVFYGMKIMDNPFQIVHIISEIAIEDSQFLLQFSYKGIIEYVGGGSYAQIQRFRSLVQI